MHKRESFHAELNGRRIACARSGDGPIDIVFSPSFVTHMDMLFAEPGSRRFSNRLADNARVVYYDKLGSGLSDPVDRIPTLEDRVEEIIRVMDAAGLERAAIVGMSEGTAAALGVAATHPDRVSHLILLAPAAFGPNPEMLDSSGDPAAPRQRMIDDAIRRGFDDPVGQDLVPTAESIAELQELFRLGWDEWGTGRFLEGLLPGYASRRRLAALERSVCSQGMARAAMSSIVSLDGRVVAEGVQAPTLILHATGDVIPIQAARYLHQAIPGSEFIAYEGNSHAPWISDGLEEILQSMLRFLTGSASAPGGSVRQSTILFCDIVASTERAAEAGDAAWNLLIERFEHEARLAVEEVDGTYVKSLGDGYLATFRGPVAAVRAAEITHEVAGELGIEVRVGLHTGQVEVSEHDVHGLAVNVAARICDAAGARQTLLSRAVRDQSTGSGAEFHAVGEHELKGIEGSWDLLGVGASPTPGQPTLVDAAAHIATPGPAESMTGTDRLLARMARVMGRRTKLDAA